MVSPRGHRDCGDCTVCTPWVPQNYKELELLRQVYYGGVEHEIRKDVWPFLLGHYKFGMSKKEVEQVGEPIPMGTGRWVVGPRDPRKEASEGSASSNMAEEDVSREKCPYG